MYYKHTLLLFTMIEQLAIDVVPLKLYYRRRVDFGMLEDPSKEISDEDLEAVIAQIQSSMPYVGTSIVVGRVRSMGYIITRERVRQALRHHDPLSNALRWPGVVNPRRPYSVAGPNSLWHIG